LTTKKILAIDGHSLLYRAYFALPDTIRDRSDRPVNAIYGFIGMLSRLLREHHPAGLLVAFDSAWPTLRHSKYPAYKGNRESLAEPLLAQVPLLKILMQRLRISSLYFPGYEADDILASLAEYSAARQTPTLIVTGDRDLFQLVRDPWVQVLYTKNGVNKTQVLDEIGVEKLVGVRPTRYAELAALRGDPSDNIAGVAGIGPKTAVEILANVPSLDDVFVLLDRFPSKMAEKLLAYQNAIRLNLELIRPLPGVPVDWDIQSLAWTPDKTEVARAFDELGLKRAGELLTSAITEAESMTSEHSTTSVSFKATTFMHPVATVCLVSCSAEKADFECNAKDLYTSALFRKSRAWAERQGHRWYILSAKHGLLPPETVVGPYDESLKVASKEDRKVWGERAVQQLKSVAAPPARIFLLAGSSYSDAITRELNHLGYRVVQPLQGMSIGKRLQWLNRAIELTPGSGELEAFYEILNRVASHTGGFLRLGEADQSAWPERGVYFFFEPGETRFCSTLLRVVRVGTHAVSANSKATLWNRLRTHRGVTEGGGNHRASIFRSHIGAAIINRHSRTEMFPAWGDQAAGTAKNKEKELELERLVSAALSKMQVVCLDIRDESSSRSDRAYIERNSIALLSKLGSRMDPPSSSWLGGWSIHPAIKKSGLWNVNYVDETERDPAFLDILDYYARATAARVPSSKNSVAPYGWWNRMASSKQIGFEWDE
jgi:5'-3' exonuclease